MSERGGNAESQTTSEEYFDKGTFYENKDTDKAIENYTLAIQLNPHYAEAIFNRAGNWEGKQEYAKAISDYEKYIELRPADPTGYDYLAMVYLHAEDKSFHDPQAALHHAKQACQASENAGNQSLQYQPFLTLAIAHGRLGQFEEAVAAQKSAIELALGDPEAELIFLPKMKEDLEKYRNGECPAGPTQ
jgi:tetratricopeptide (TPR) repeat protein